MNVINNSYAEQVHRQGLLERDAENAYLSLDEAEEGPMHIAMVGLTERVRCRKVF